MNYLLHVHYPEPPPPLPGDWTVAPLISTSHFTCSFPLGFGSKERLQVSVCCFTVGAGCTMDREWCLKRFHERHGVQGRYTSILRTTVTTITRHCVDKRQVLVSHLSVFKCLVKSCDKVSGGGDLKRYQQLYGLRQTLPTGTCHPQLLPVPLLINVTPFVGGGGEHCTRWLYPSYECNGALRTNIVPTGRALPSCYRVWYAVAVRSAQLNKQKSVF